MRTLPTILFLLTCLLAATPCVAQTMALTSLEWPPYTGVNLVDDGASAKVVREALTAAGMDLQIRFFPWQRAVQTAREDGNFIGYFPEYHAESIEADFLFSDPIGTSPLGFIENAEKPVSWAALGDLKPYTIGVVSGYVNTGEFDALMESGQLKTDPVTDDATNIRKVAAGRIDLAVMDRNVFLYLLRTDPELRALEGKLRFNDRLLENKKLYVCLRKSPDGEAALNKLNEGLARIDVDGTQDGYIQRALAR
jgi:polar amino acid transport system substrate-binding protein